MQTFISGRTRNYLYINLETLTVALPERVIAHHDIVPLMEALEAALETLNRTARRAR